MELKAKVKQVLPLQSGVSARGEWKKATLIMEYGEEYPKEVAVSNMKKADDFVNLPVGTELVMQVEATSREFNGKWYTNIDCWKWEVATVVAQSQQLTPEQIKATYSQPQTQAPKQAVDDSFPF